MKSAPYKYLPTKKLPKSDREQAVLFGLIELYLKTGKPVGSQTMQEHGFESLSSATIRNYFSKLDEEGYLKQHHTSGGRIPTEKALRLYAEKYRLEGVVEKEQETILEQAFSKETSAIASLLNQAAEGLSELTQCAVFLSAPRFDQDFIQNVKLVGIDATTVLSVVVTDFGLIRTETIYLEKPVTPLFLRTCEEYFLWRITKGEKPLFQTDAETKLAQKIYNEVMVRHVVGYANFPNEEIVRAGLARLLSYPEFNDATALANSLALLEDEGEMRAILRKALEQNELVLWVGDDLCPHVPPESECAVIAIPYRINQALAGSIAILGPTRLPYRNLFGMLQMMSEKLSQALTKNLYKYKITFRTPKNADKLIEKK